MPNPFDNSPFGSPARNRDAAAGQTLVYILFAFAAGDMVIGLTLFLLSGQIGHRRYPPAPPAAPLRDLLYAAGLLLLLAGAAWIRLRAPLSLSTPEFQRQVFISYALANANLYLGFFWIARGGAFLPSVPFFAGPALVVLLFILPPVLKRAAALRASR